MCLRRLVPEGDRRGFSANSTNISYVSPDESTGDTISWIAGPAACVTVRPALAILLVMTMVIDQGVEDPLEEFVQ